MDLAQQLFNKKMTGCGHNIPHIWLCCSIYSTSLFIGHDTSVLYSTCDNPTVVMLMLMYIGLKLWKPLMVMLWHYLTSVSLVLAHPLIHRVSKRIEKLTPVSLCFGSLVNPLLYLLGTQTVYNSPLLL